MNELKLQGYLEKQSYIKDCITFAQSKVTLLIDSFIFKIDFLNFPNARRNVVSWQ